MNHDRNMNNQGPEHTQHSVGYERSDAPVRPLVKFLIALSITSLVVFAAMGWLFNLLVRRASELDRPPSPIAEDRQIPPSPQLQISPPADLEQLRRSEERILNSYGWRDRQAGVARIPIDRAMDLLLERGLAHREEESSSEQSRDQPPPRLQLAPLSPAEAGAEAGREGAGP